MTLFAQIATVPFFIHSVGISRYGEWLILIALPSYVAMSDMGLGTTAANAMSLKAGKENSQSEMSVIFASCWYMIALLNLGFVLLLIAVFYLLQNLGFYKIQTISQSTADQILVLYLLYMAVSVQCSLSVAVYKAHMRYALGTFINNSIRLVESLCIILVLLLSNNLVHVALTYLVVRCIGYIVLIRVAAGLMPTLTFRVAAVDFRLIRSYLAPSLNFLLFSAGVNMTPQAVILILGRFFSPSLVVAFSMSRTVSRLGLQAMNAISTSVWAEYSLLAGKGLFDKIVDLNRKALRIAALMGVCFVIFVAAAGPKIIDIWSKGRISDATHWILGGLAIAYSIQGIWLIMSSILTSQNLHSRISLFYSLINAVLIAILVCTGRWITINEVIAMICVVELAMLIYTIVTTSKYLGRTTTSFARSIIGARG
ncbi:MAG: lipopolysaccharide biosynthesis protein [Janthinobacterium lividum]